VDASVQGEHGDRLAEQSMHTAKRAVPGGVLNLALWVLRELPLLRGCHVLHAREVDVLPIDPSIARIAYIRTSPT
jgi:hypothetical protein